MLFSYEKWKVRNQQIYKEILNLARKQQSTWYNGKYPQVEELLLTSSTGILTMIYQRRRNETKKKASVLDRNIAHLTGIKSHFNYSFENRCYL